MKEPLYDLERRLAQFEQENATNPMPVRADFRLDAGFGTPENVALLIELGYEVYIKPHGTWLRTRLKKQVDAETIWTQVGHNAEMTAWAAMAVQDFPYPLDLALERFYTGNAQRLSVMLHYGQDPVTADLPAWFQTCNGRQTIEAGIKEGKQVFQMQHLKVRSEAALFLQEHFAAFAANFVRWAAHWLTTQCPQESDGWQAETLPGVKTQVQVLVHTSAFVAWHEQGCLLRFTDHSVFTVRRLLPIIASFPCKPLIDFGIRDERFRHQLIRSCRHQFFRDLSQETKHSSHWPGADAHARDTHVLELRYGRRRFTSDNVNRRINLFDQNGNGLFVEIPNIRNKYAISASFPICIAPVNCITQSLWGIILKHDHISAGIDNQMYPLGNTHFSYRSDFVLLKSLVEKRSCRISRAIFKIQSHRADIQHSLGCLYDAFNG
jgi:hypothetical protein